MDKTLSFLFSLYRLNAIMNRRLASNGLDFNDFMIIYHLAAAPDKKLRRVDLAQRLGLTASGVTRMLIPLEKLHIVKRDQDESDNRARFASLTPAGDNLLQDALYSLEIKLDQVLSDDELKKLPDASLLIDQLSERLSQTNSIETKE